MKRLIVTVLVLAACRGESATTKEEMVAANSAPAAPASVAAPALEKKAEGVHAKAGVALQGGASRLMADSGSAQALGAVGGSAPAAPSEAPAAPSRSWFPETFLFRPLVVTDAGGAATVSVPVPDRLTSWRVLALAHSRAGAQAGAVTSFLGTLDTYVDAVVPPFLLVGDEVRLPVQVVNTTDAPIAAELRLAAENATLVPARTQLRIPANGSAVAYATLKTLRPGTVALRAALGQADAVVRSFPVLPTGRPVTVSHGGTLAAPRTLAIDVPAGADPAASAVRVLVYPGAVAVLRAELAATLDRAGVAEDAYTLRLAGRATALLAAFGDKADPEAIRQLGLVAGQRALHHARTLDVMSASLLAAAAFAHPDNPVLARLAERALDYLAQNQRPDGTFGGGAGWTLQRVLVATADGTRAVQVTAGSQRARAVALRAEGAIERNLERVDDGYTAAALVASGAVTGELATRLRAEVRTAVKPRDDGTKILEVRDGVVRADGAVPFAVEATALAILALADPKSDVRAGPDADLLADLGTTVLGAYRSPGGWGDGRANLVCLDAVLRLFAAPVAPGIHITLALDGTAVADGTIDAERLHDVLALSASAPASGRHVWQLTATPATPGLAFAFAQTSYVPWQAPPGHGVELAAAAPTDLRVGRPATLAVKAAAPAGRELGIHQGLPAGLQVDGPSMDKLVADRVIVSWHAHDGALDLVAPPLQPGQTFVALIRVVPTLAGVLSAPASTLTVGGAPGYETPPVVWTVR